MQRFSHFYLLCMLFCLCQQQASATTYTLINTGTWTDPSIWSPAGVPGAADEVILDIPSAVLYLNTNITVRVLRVERLALLQTDNNGGQQNKLTVASQFISKYPTSYQVDLDFLPGATAEFNNDNYSAQFSSTYVNGEIKVGGSMLVKDQGLYAVNFVINGTVNNQSSALVGEIKINQGGVLNLNNPGVTTQVGSVINAGTLNWNSGDLLWPANMLNEGLFVIAASDSLYNDDFGNTTGITNRGTIRVAPSVTRAVTMWRTRNEGIIEIPGASRLKLTALRHTGTITGGANSVLEVNGVYFDTWSSLESGSIVSVGTLRTYPSSELRIKPGADIAQVSKFEFTDGWCYIGVPLPGAATYLFEGQTNLEVAQTFTGNVVFRNGAVIGPYAVTFNTQNLTIDNTTFANDVTTIPAGVTAQTSGFYSINLINNGTLLWNQAGELRALERGFTNNGSMLITIPTAAFYSSTSQINTPQFINNGSITFDVAGAGVLNVTGFMENRGQITLVDDTLRIVGGLDQFGQINGNGSVFELYAYPYAHFKQGSTTSNFDRLSTSYAQAFLVEAGAQMNNIGAYIFDQSNVEFKNSIDVTVPYTLNYSVMRLNAIFEPTETFTVYNSKVEGSGSIRIAKELDWKGGEIDVPVRIQQDAFAQIRESAEERPIISAPFTNLGDVILTGGIVELNTSFFKNTGQWTVKSEEDVIIDGVTPFVNEGGFATCGTLPIQLVFNVPFINEPTGLFQGSGSYTFNAGYTNNGIAAPGCSPGQLEILDNFRTGAGLDIEIEGNATGQYDVFKIQGNLVLSGTLRVLVPTGAAPSGPITVVETTGLISGAFSDLQLPLNYTATITDRAIIINTTGLVSSNELTTGSRWSIAPTLATDRVLISVLQPLNTDVQIQIINAQGQLVQQAQMAAGVTSSELQVAQLPQGVYQVMMSDGFSAKMVKI